MAILKNYDTSLIRTKYSMPKANQYLVSRRRLHQKLNSCLNRKLTLVTAPAGYGKTTALVEWLEDSNLPAAWLFIDTEDNNPMLFWRYACAALDKMAEGINIDVEYVFTSQELLKADIQINILIDRLAIVEQDFLFIIDDIHLITNPLILRGLSYLIKYLPPRMHLILISRTRPALELAKFEIKLQMLEIGEKDLRFREEEISQFYRLRGLRLETGEVQKVESYTEGWAAALVTIAMSMERDSVSNDMITRIARCRDGIYQYLKDEVIEAWPPEKKKFALKTSVLDTLCESLCDAITGDSNGGYMLQDLSERSEFLIPLDDENTYRYHHLLKNFLYELLHKSDPAGLLEMHVRAAVWYQEQGLTSQAIEHYLSGQMYDHALILIEPQLADLASGANPSSYTVESPDVTITNHPTRSGFEFAGWTGTGLSEATMDVTIPTGSTENRTYTANWIPAPGFYNLTFDANGGQGGITIRLAPDDPIPAPPSVTHAGYDFMGWLTVADDYDTGFTVDGATMPDNDLTLYAWWSYEVAFDPNGEKNNFGETITEVERYGINYNSWVQLPHRISADQQYALGSWNTNADGSGVSFDSDFVLNLPDVADYTIDGDGIHVVTLYAQWIPYDECGIFNAMYSAVADYSNDTLDYSSEDFPYCYDASTSDELVLDVFYMQNKYFMVKKTGDAENPIALYLYDSGSPVMSENAPEGSLIGSGNYDGCTDDCNQSLQSLYGTYWADGLVTVGNITALWESNIAVDDDDNPVYDGEGNEVYTNFGFIFTSVNGVSYFVSGRINVGSADSPLTDLTVIKQNPTMEDIEEVHNYELGPYLVLN